MSVEAAIECRIKRLFVFRQQFSSILIVKIIKQVCLCVIIYYYGLRNANNFQSFRELSTLYAHASKTHLEYYFFFFNRRFRSM